MFEPVMFKSLRGFEFTSEADKTKIQTHKIA